jgi:N-dimethylarginine dimethylaminohydrolase
MPRSARILMCPPTHFGIHYEINPWMSVERGHDEGLAHAQWRGLAERLESLGVSVERIEPVEGLPDLVFTANAGLVRHDRFISSRFRHGVRQGESVPFQAWFARRGFQVEELPEGTFFEGAGDALFCGETLFAGYRIRSDVRGLNRLGETLSVEVLPLELVDPRFYHLDTCFCPLSDREALYFPGAFDDYGRSVLQSQVPGLIEVSEPEAAGFCCNAVVVGRTVILNSGSDQAAAELARRGYAPVMLPFTEFLKSGGSAKCLTLRLDGEEAAAWAQSGSHNPGGE